MLREMISNTNPPQSYSKPYESTEKALTQTRRGETDYGEHDRHVFVKSMFWEMTFTETLHNSLKNRKNVHKGFNTKPKGGKSTMENTIGMFSWIRCFEKWRLQKSFITLVKYINRPKGLQYKPEGGKSTMENTIGMFSRNRCSENTKAEFWGCGIFKNLIFDKWFFTWQTCKELKK